MKAAGGRAPLALALAGPGLNLCADMLCLDYVGSVILNHLSLQQLVRCMGTSRAMRLTCLQNLGSRAHPLAGVSSDFRGYEEIARTQVGSDTERGPRWRDGASVVLHSLVGAVQVLNGATGTVERYLEGEQSYVVRMRRDGVLVPVKASNLKAAEAAAPGPGAVAATPAAAAAAAAPWRDGMVTVEGWNGLV